MHVGCPGHSVTGVVVIHVQYVLIYEMNRFLFQDIHGRFPSCNTCYVTYSIYKLNLIPSVSQAIYRIIDWLIFPAVVSEVTNQKSLN